MMHGQKNIKSLNIYILTGCIWHWT